MSTVADVFGVIHGIDTGFTNDGTWAVALWLGSGKAEFEYWRGAAREARDEARESPEVREGLRAEADAVRHRLASRLMSEVRDRIPLGEPGLYADLLRLALAEVDWLQVADRFVDLPE